MGEQGCGCGGCGCGSSERTSSSERTGSTVPDPSRAGTTTGPVSRRVVLGGSAAAVAAIALAGCGSDEPAASTTTPGAATSEPAASPTSSPTEDGSEASGEPIATVGEFPVGGGKVVSTGAGAVVITQPADGEYLAFDARCPHQGCPVAEVTENTILCTCHGSTFDGSTGERLEGPAPTGLQPVAIVVEGDDILLA